MSRYSNMDQKMKEWEHDFRRPINPYNYVLLRIDGKAFHTYTRGLKKPFDFNLMDAMDYASLNLAKEIQGVKLVYTQSDEISVLITAWNDESLARGIKPELWMGGVEAKILSISASIATAYFNAHRVGTFEQSYRMEEFKPGLFDSRVWTFPGTEEGFQLVQEYFEWRLEDCQRNSISMQAQAHFSHNELISKGQLAMVRMLNDIGYEWQDVPKRASFGHAFYKVPRLDSVVYMDKRSGEERTTEVTRNMWTSIPFSTPKHLWEYPGVLPQPPHKE